MCSESLLAQRARAEVSLPERLAHLTQAKFNVDAGGIASVEHLLIMKRIAGGPEDLLAAASPKFCDLDAPMLSLSATFTVRRG